MNRRLLPAVLTAAAIAAGPWAGPAAATSTPQVPGKYEQVERCIQDTTAPAAVTAGVSWGQRELGYTSLWEISRGTGVKVAVIDTGVTPGPAFGDRLIGAEDLIVPGQGGLRDCDGHGTLVAGLIAASPDPKTGFAGVAPEATIVSIRQSSRAYAPLAQNGAARVTAGSASTLATAIRTAVAAKVHVINISEVICGPAGTVDNSDLRAAVQEAVAADVVVVVAGGNLSGQGRCSAQNPPGQPVVTGAAPANVPGVLAVAAVDEDGAPAGFSLNGPWLRVAAPGTRIVSTSPFPSTGGQIDALPGQQGPVLIAGTSFAAPYVAGVAALVRSRYPNLTAAQVVARIEATAAHPVGGTGRDDRVGFGLVDPRAALTAQLPDGAGPATPAVSRDQRLAPEPQYPAQRLRQLIALAGAGGAALLLLAGGIYAAGRRRAG